VCIPRLLLWPLPRRACSRCYPCVTIRADAMLVLGHEHHGEGAVTVPVGNAFLACPFVTGASSESPRSIDLCSRDIRIMGVAGASGKAAVRWRLLSRRTVRGLSDLSSRGERPRAKSNPVTVTEIRNRFFTEDVIHGILPCGNGGGETIFRLGSRLLEDRDWKVIKNCAFAEACSGAASMPSISSCGNTH